MIHLVKGETNEIVVTLTEKSQLETPNYLFVFKSLENNKLVKFVLLNNADISSFKTRFNKFNIVVNNYFATAKVGEFTYSIYEQISTTNLDPTLASNLLEVGQMNLKNSSNFNFTTHNSTNTYNVREI